MKKFCQGFFWVLWMMISRLYAQTQMVDLTVYRPGLGVPWYMDGVGCVIQDPIMAQQECEYGVKIEQAGTYGYAGSVGASGDVLGVLSLPQEPSSTIPAVTPLSIAENNTAIKKKESAHPTKSAGMTLTTDTASMSAALNIEPHNGLSITNDWQYAHDFARNVDQLTATTLLGSDNNKIEFYTNQAQLTRGTLTNAAVDIFAWHALNDSWAIKGGANYSYRPAAYWQPGTGLEGTAPFGINTNIRSYWHAGSGLLDIDVSRNTHLTGKWFLLTEIQSIAATQAVENAQIGQGLNNIQYTLGPSFQWNDSLALQLQYQYIRSYGSTVKLLKEDEQSMTQNLLTFGLEVVF